MMDSVQRLITAKDYCAREGAKSIKDRIMKLHARRQKKSKIPLPIKIDDLSQRTVKARIELGQVIADCECGGAEFVDRDEPIFYCFQCFNRKDGGALRPVIFPSDSDWAEISRLVLMRPVDDIRGLDDADRAANAKAIIYIESADGRHLPLTRTWMPGETIDNLRAENLAVEKWQQVQEEKAGE